MEPRLWGSYGWKMIHAVSVIPGMTMTSYRRWLNATAMILPCRKCRSNFKNHIRSTGCVDAQTPPDLGICLHTEVSKALGKKTRDAGYTIRDIPKPSVGDILEPSFWLAVAGNTTIRKTNTLRTWFKETERILTGWNTQASTAVLKLQSGVFGTILGNTSDTNRKKGLTNAVRKMLVQAGVSKERIPTQGSISRMRVSKTRRRIVSSEIGSVPLVRSRASKKRRQTDRRNSRSETRRRTRHASSKTSSG